MMTTFEPVLTYVCVHLTLSDLYETVINWDCDEPILRVN